ncbi:MAG: pilus assembly protein PilM [Deltaproteobacteria bacterium]|nr:pilus assembly protein PilM [Deltaproteobacteria bacterium]MBW2398279.1 pilus assembly protein PilM [Deltaproteobacteria bacterium]
MALLKNVLGLDIGSHSLKAVEIRQSLRSFEAVAMRTLPRRDDETPLPELVSRFLELHHLSTEHVVCALPGIRLSSRRLKFPFTDNKKIRAAIPFEVEEDLPLEIDDCLIDWEKIHSDRASADIIATIAPRTEVSRFTEPLIEANCAPQTLEAEGLALANLVALFDLPGTRMLVDLGHSKTTFCVLVNGRAIAARTVAVAGRDLTAAVAADGGLDLERAEAVKCESGLSGSGAKTRAVIDRIAREINRTLSSLEEILAHLGSGPIAELTLFGGSAQLIGIEEALSERTGIPAHRLGLPHEGHGDHLSADGPPLVYAPALALALRGTAQARTRMNFLQQEFAVRIDLSRYRKDFGWTAWLGGIALALGVASFATGTILELRQAEAVEATVEQMYSEAFPDAPEPDNPIAALRTAVKEANERADFLGVYPGNLSALDILSEISRLIPQNLEIVFEDVSIDRQTIRMKCYVKKFESADRLGVELAKFPPFERAQIGSIENDAKRGGKRFTVTISLATMEDSA